MSKPTDDSAAGQAGDLPASPARLYLVTPPDVDLAVFPAALESALAAGDVAAVLIAGQGQEHDMAAIAETLVPIIQRYGAAALLENHSRIAARTGADGVHVSGGQTELVSALQALKPKMIVGAGTVKTRHGALQAGESGADYVFFGKPHGDIRPEPHAKALKLAQWWCSIIEVPAVVMAGSALNMIGEVAATGAEFIALNKACWSHPGGPHTAVAEALERIAAAPAAAMENA